MRVSELMTDRPSTLSRGASLQAAMDVMDEQDLRHIIVLDGQEVAGVLGDRDLLDLTGWLHPRQREVLEAPEGCLGDHLQREVVTVTPDQSVPVAAELLLAERIGCLPVVQEGVLRGVLSDTDILRAYADACRTGRVMKDEQPTLESLMTPAPHTAEAEEPADLAAERMREHGVRHLPVLARGSLVGILSDRDIRRGRGRGQLETQPVSALMGAGLETARPSDRLQTAALILSTLRVGALPVVENGKLLGIVSLVDVLRPCATGFSEES